MITLLSGEADVAPPVTDEWVAPLFHRPIPPGERACCCPARAAFAVVVAPSAKLPDPPDVMLCGHHARRAYGRMAGDRIALYDAHGELVRG